MQFFCFYLKILRRPSKMFHFLAKLKHKIAKYRNKTMKVINHHINRKPNLMKVLSQEKDLSIMHDLLKQSPIKDLLAQASKHTVRKVCFENDLCVRVAGDVRKHFKALCKAKRFTVHALNNDYFNQLKEETLKQLQEDAVTREAFLLKHIYLGTLRHGNSKGSGVDVKRLIGVSLQKLEPVSEWIWNNGEKIIAKPGESAFVVDREMKVKEGLVQILKMARQEN